MFEVLQLSIDELTDEVRKMRKMNREYMTHIAATDEIWATIIEDFPEMIPSIVKDMRFRAAKIREIMGSTVGINL